MGRTKRITRQEKSDRKNKRISVKNIIERCSINDKRNLTKNKVIKREEGRRGVIKMK
jgi:hypothetical protein